MQPSISTIRLLIVEDIAETRDNLTNLLYFEKDIEIIGIAINGLEGIEKAYKLKPDIILMDINMPELDGLSATERIRKIMPNISVIIMSVQGEQDYLRRAMQAGAAEFLVKPFSGDELISSLRHVYKSELASIRFIPNLDKNITKNGKFEFENNLLKKVEFSEQMNLYHTDYEAVSILSKHKLLASGIAHDLRSPLSLILGTLISRISSTNDKQVELLLNKIHDLTTFAYWIIDNFLYISFFEKINIKEVSLENIIENTLQLLNTNQGTAVRLNIQIPKHFTILSDLKRLRIILLNLLMNSLEIIPSDGLVNIEVNTRKTSTEIIINDTGSGIEANVIPHLFKLGYTTKQNHSGIGLFVARKISRSLFGDIRYIPNKRGAGTTFILEIPNDYPSFVDVEQSDNLAKEVSELEKNLGISREYSLNQSYTNNTEAIFDQIITNFSTALISKLEEISFLTQEVPQDFPPEIDKILLKIKHNCSYALLLAHNVAEVGNAKLCKYTNIYLPDIIEEILNLLERKMPTDLYQVFWELDPTLPEIQADPMQIKQIFMNLLKNALDAMPNGGQITIKLERENQWALIYISDTGIGISNNNLNNLFKLGYTTKSGGFGIGLYNVKTLVEKHNGMVQVVSRINVGTTFKIAMPINQEG